MVGVYGSTQHLGQLSKANEVTRSSVHDSAPTHLTADEQFDELCFEFGIELDEVVCLRDP